MSVLIAIGFDEAPVVVAAYDVGLQAGMIRIYNSFVWLSREIAIGCGAVSNRYNTGFLKVCNPRRRGRHQLVIRIYGWRCTDRAIEPFARHDVRCAKGPSLLVISMIYSGICGQGKNADTPFATVNPEGMASSPPKR